MADTTVQGKIELWIVENELGQFFGGRTFSKRKVPLKWGGAFEFDAVSADGRVVVCVSTSCCRTASGRNAIGKFHKLKADALYLLQTACGEPPTAWNRPPVRRFAEPLRPPYARFA
jgi:hypothetical protein